MSDKYLNIDLNDPRASAIADVMGNKTAKKILDIIADKDKELTESDIASELSLPLNTVGYNIDKLLKAGLIEKSKNYFWSAKGKKMPTYKISNKKILISPKRLSVAPMALIASIVGVLIIAMILFNSSNSPIASSINESKNIFSNDELRNLKQFSNYEELESFLNDRINTSQNNNYYFRGGMEFEASAPNIAAATDSASKSSGGSADSYSQTNNQVEGVDEPDFVKNDGKYIYQISGNNLYIIEAYPAQDMKIIANVSLGNYANNMFVNQDKLIVFMNAYKENIAYSDPLPETNAKIASSSLMPCYGFRCGGYSQPLTNVIVYDISDRENPIVENNYTFSGSYTDARMIGDYVYTISQQYVYNEWPRPLYTINGVENEISIDKLYYSDELDQNFAFTTVSAISLNDGEVENKVYLLGTSGTIYVSENNIYLTQQKWMDYQKQIELKLSEGIIPVMPSEYENQLNDIMDDDSLNYYEKDQKIMKIVYNYSSHLDKEEQSDFNKNLQESLNEAEIKIAKEYQKTTIHKIKIDGKDIEYVAEGEVPGYLLNQFSLDEYDGKLRVAVTTGQMWGGNNLNHLYVLDEELKIIGSVEDLAKGERIYSARFMGERAYMVTFRQVDPLYVIDLKDPSNPSVLGYLKVTGYSSYLHPYDENSIIGVGMEGDENGRVNGIKIALFDVTDVNNPVEKAKYTIKSETGWSWSSSDALYDHKAFLFDKEKNLLVIPVQYSMYDEKTLRSNNWNGVYVFHIDSESIELDAKISHIDPYSPKYGDARDADIGEERTDAFGTVWTKIGEDRWRAEKEYENYEKQFNESYKDQYYGYGSYNPYEQGNEGIDYFPGGTRYDPYNYNWDKRIQRSLYMDDTLYTVSSGMIKANSLKTFGEIKSVEFSSSQIFYPAVY